MLPLLERIRAAVDVAVAAQPVPYRTSPATPAFESLRRRRTAGACSRSSSSRFQCTRFEMADFARRARDIGVGLHRHLLRRRPAPRARHGRGARARHPGQPLLARHRAAPGARRRRGEAARRSWAAGRSPSRAGGVPLGRRCVSRRPRSAARERGPGPARVRFTFTTECGAKVERVPRPLSSRLESWCAISRRGSESRRSPSPSPSRPTAPAQPPRPDGTPPRHPRRAPTPQQLLQLERRVEVAHGQLLVRGAGDELAHHAAVERVAARRPQDRPLDRLDLLDRGVGIELARRPPSRPSAGRTNATFARTAPSPIHGCGIALTTRAYAGRSSTTTFTGSSKPLARWRPRSSSASRLRRRRRSRRGRCRWRCRSRRRRTRAARSTRGDRPS